MASNRVGLGGLLFILAASICLLIGVVIWRGVLTPDLVQPDVAALPAVTKSLDAAPSSPSPVASAEVPEINPPLTASVDVAAPTPPKIQEVRLEVGGLSVIAGQAAPLSEVILFVDDAEVARTSADASGSFATLATLGSGSKIAARPLTVKQRDERGVLVEGEDTIFLAPVPQPSEQSEVVASIADPVAPVVSAGAPDTLTQAGPDPSPDVQESSAQEAAPAKIAVLKSDATGIEVLSPATPAPAVTGQVALDTISYSVDGAVKLQGRAQGGAQEVRVYLDNSVIAALTVDDSGSWRGTLPEVEIGVFTLRIDEVNVDGTVTSRVETPFKREDPAILTSVVSQEKTDLIKAITVQQGHTLWAIARDRYGEGIQYVQVFEANRSLIRDPNLIYPGQVLALPQK